MKRKKLNLDAKLFLKKSVVHSLNDANKGNVLGGGTEQSICVICTPPSQDTNCPTMQLSVCPTYVVGDRCCAPQTYDFC